MNSTGIKCGDCGEPLMVDDREGRQPCSHCGGTSREYSKTISSRVQVSGSLRWTHTKTFYEENRMIQIWIAVLSLGGLLLGSFAGPVGIAISLACGVAAYFLGPRAVITIREIRHGKSEDS